MTLDQTITIHYMSKSIGRVTAYAFEATLSTT